MNKDQEMLMGRGFSPYITMKKQAEYWSGKVNHEICIFMTEIIEFTKSKTINSMRQSNLNKPNINTVESIKKLISTLACQLEKHSLKTEGTTKKFKLTKVAKQDEQDILVLGKNNKFSNDKTITHRKMQAS